MKKRINPANAHANENFSPFSNKYLNTTYNIMAMVMATVKAIVMRCPHLRSVLPPKPSFVAVVSVEFPLKSTSSSTVTAIGVASTATGIDSTVEESGFGADDDVEGGKFVFNVGNVSIFLKLFFTAFFCSTFFNRSSI